MHTNRAPETGFTISGTRMPAIVLCGELRPFVRRATEDVAGDLERIFGVRPQIVTDDIPATNAIILKKSGTGWEKYSLISAPENILHITGSNDRGVMFGLYRFAQDFLEVDPFYWWADNFPSRRETRTWDNINLAQDEPSFKFRTFFINDEDFLNGFMAEKNGKRAIAYERYHVCFGTELADRIYEAFVRAGFNAAICASYVDILNPDEKRLIEIAAGRGLFITTHHQEPLGAGALQLDLHFPEIRDTTYASAPEIWRAAWKKYVTEWAEIPDVIWMLGLRGRKDMPFWQKNFGENEICGAQADQQHADLISQAMAEQLAIITESLGHAPEYYATQLWMEGAEFYRRDLLKIPDGAIVILSDNSPGGKFQPDLGMRDHLDPRQKFGLYYHLAVVAGNHHTELMPPLRSHQIISDAYAKGARDLIMYNVSNVRPFLFTLAAAGEMSRDLAHFSAENFQNRWSEKYFGTENVPAVTRAIDLYFSAYETEYARDRSSSYGSPREAAPLPVLNDGILASLTMQALNGIFNEFGQTRPAPASQYNADPYRMRAIDEGGPFCTTDTQDMFPLFAEEFSGALRAGAQATGFARVFDVCNAIEASLSSARRELFFTRFTYPAGFMQTISATYAEVSLAREASRDRNTAAVIQHLQEAEKWCQKRETLEKRYLSGKWEHFYDRRIIYSFQKHLVFIRHYLDLLRQHGEAALSGIKEKILLRLQFGTTAPAPVETARRIVPVAADADTREFFLDLRALYPQNVISGLDGHQWAELEFFITAPASGTYTVEIHNDFYGQLQVNDRDCGAVNGPFDGWKDFSIALNSGRNRILFSTRNGLGGKWECGWRLPDTRLEFQ